MDAVNGDVIAIYEFDFVENRHMMERNQSVPSTIV